MHKRDFLRTVGRASLGAMFAPAVLERYLALPHTELAEDEAFWRTIRAKYRLTSDYINLHRSKRLIQLDLRDDDDRRRFFQLVERADVLVENNRPPVKIKLGIDYERCAAVNPRLVYGSISGYGQEGPASAKGAVDQVIQGAAD